MDRDFSLAAYTEHREVFQHYSSLIFRARLAIATPIVLYFGLSASMLSRPGTGTPGGSTSSTSSPPFFYSSSSGAKPHPDSAARLLMILAPVILGFAVTRRTPRS